MSVGMAAWYATVPPSTALANVFTSQTPPLQPVVGVQAMAKPARKPTTQT
jgi:hypothetical protein